MVKNESPERSEYFEPHEFDDTPAPEADGGPPQLRGRKCTGHSDEPTGAGSSELDCTGRSWLARPAPPDSAREEPYKGGNCGSPIFDGLSRCEKCNPYPPDSDREAFERDGDFTCSSCVSLSQRLELATEAMHATRRALDKANAALIAAQRERVEAVLARYPGPTFDAIRRDIAAALEGK